jgi:diacylglycerol O-acyltransferase
MAAGLDRPDDQRAGQGAAHAGPGGAHDGRRDSRAERGDGEVIVTAAGRAPATLFNKPITPHRRFAFRSVDLDTVKMVKMVKNTFAVSVNDVVMAMCAGALRRWLTDHDALPSQPLIAMIPVSVRDPAGKGALGNKVSAMLAELPTNVRDPGRRPDIVHAATKIAKAQQAAIPQGLVNEISDFAPPALTARAARVVFVTGVLHRLPPFNVTISNVPARTSRSTCAAPGWSPTTRCRWSPTARA